MGIWERDEGIRTAVEAGLGELAAEVRAGRHPAELAGARLELLTVSPAARGWAFPLPKKSSSATMAPLPWPPTRAPALPSA